MKRIKCSLALLFTIINGENIYHQQADEEDKCFAIVSLLTLGVMKAPIIEEARYSAKNLHNGNDCLSFIKSIRDGYEQILEKNHCCFVSDYE